MSEDWGRERQLVVETFAEMLKAPTGDGSVKRQRGEKPPWWRDGGHTSAFYRHLEQWESGERYAPDSRVHHLISAAWRLLAIAYQDINGPVEPQ